MRSFVVLLFALASVCAGAEWDGFKATFGKYHDLPWDVTEATAQKQWVKIDEDKRNNVNVYSQPDNPRMMLLFDKKGTIAGVRLAFLKDDVAKKAKAAGTPFDVKYDETPMFQTGNYFGKALWYMSVLFTPPSILASGGRRKLNKATDELADGVYFYDGTKWIEVSKDECKISADFTEANCYPGMGKHYFYKLDKNTDCARRASIFPLYTKGRLAGFGLGGYGSFTEHPKTKNFYESISSDAVKNIVPNGPKCMPEYFGKYGFTSVHYFLIGGAPNIDCPAKDWRSTHC